MKSLNSTEGIASVLLLKVYILQIIKQTQDTLDSDEDDEELVPGNSSKTIGRSSKKTKNIIEHAIEFINNSSVIHAETKKK